VGADVGGILLCFLLFRVRRGRRADSRERAPARGDLGRPTGRGVGTQDSLTSYGIPGRSYLLMQPVAWWRTITQDQPVHVMMTIHHLRRRSVWGISCGLRPDVRGVGACPPWGREVLNARLEVAADGRSPASRALPRRDGVYDVGIFLFFPFQWCSGHRATTSPAHGEPGSSKPSWSYGSSWSMIFTRLRSWVWGGVGSPAGSNIGWATVRGSRLIGVQRWRLCPWLAPTSWGRVLAASPLTASHAPSPAQIPMAIVGVIILVFGWFGFNAGSTLNGGT